MPSETDSRILHKLEEWKQRDGQLPDFVDLYACLLRLQAEAKSRTTVPKPTLAKDAINDHLREGIPLLTFESLSPDWRLLQGLFKRIATTIVEHSAVPPKDAESLRKVASDISLLRKAVKAWYERTPLPLPEAEPGASQALLTATVQATLHPFLTLQAEALIPLVNQETWRRGYCPICGGLPDFAFLDRERGARWLLCCLCDACWLFQRVCCPYCGNAEQSSLSYLTNEEGAYRLYLCDKCHGYLKAVDLRKKEGEVSMPWERIQTLELDWQAQQEGYQALAGLLSIKI